MVCIALMVLSTPKAGDVAALKRIIAQELAVRHSVQELVYLDTGAIAHDTDRLEESDRSLYLNIVRHEITSRDELARIVELKRNFPILFFNEYGSFSNLDVTRVQDFSGVFRGDARQIDVVPSFGWDEEGSSFIEGIASWDMSEATSMRDMFRSYHPGHLHIDVTEEISNWDTSKVTDMEYMFKGSSITADISQWNTSKVRTMRGMFTNARNFNADISRKPRAWNTSNVRDMRAMFRGAALFNANLADWDTSQCVDMSYMFAGAAAFDFDRSQWDTSKVIWAEGMLRGR